MAIVWGKKHHHLPDLEKKSFGGFQTSFQVMIENPIIDQVSAWHLCMSLLHPFYWVIEKHFWPTTNACSGHLHISLYPDSGWLRPHDSLIQKALNRDSLRYVSCWEVLSKDSTVSFQDKTNRWQLISSSSLYHHFCCWKWSPFRWVQILCSWGYMLLA